MPLGAVALAQLPYNLKEAENFLIQRALDETGGNIAAAARLLGTNRPRVYKYLENNSQGADLTS